MAYDPLNPDTDPFKPPAIPTEVGCLHCGQVYESYLIEWRIETDSDGKPHGFWCCPMPDCDGRGFSFDIWPTDPEYRGEDGRLFVCSDEDDDAEYDEDLDDLDLSDQNGRDRPNDDAPPPNSAPRSNGAQTEQMYAIVWLERASHRNHVKLVVSGRVADS